MNLVVVSNRVARANANEPMTGGLAAALLPVVEKSGAIWVGSSGRVRDGHQKEPFAEVEALGAGALAMLDLPAAHYGGYYEGFANSALWPALHSRSDLIRVTQGDYVSYREVNALVASWANFCGSMPIGNTAARVLPWREATMPSRTTSPRSDST